MTEYVYNRNTSHVHHPFVRSKERVIQLDVFYTVTLRDVLCHFYNVLFVRTMFSVLIIHFLQSSLEYCNWLWKNENFSNLIHYYLVNSCAPLNYSLLWLKIFIDSVLILTVYHLLPVVGENGEVLIIHNISRYCEDLYECVAVNGISPAASKEIKVTVECKVYSSTHIHVVEYFRV